VGQSRPTPDAAISVVRIAHSHSHKRESTASPDNTSTSNEGKRGRGNSRKRPSVDFPSGWKPSPTSIGHGEGLGFSPAEIDRSFGKFRGHHIAKGSRFADWDQAFRNWLDKDAEYLGRKPRDDASGTNGAAVFLMMPESLQFQAWKTHYSDIGKTGMVRQLNQREMEGRPWPFESEWPPKLAASNRGKSEAMDSGDRSAEPKVGGLS